MNIPLFLSNPFLKQIVMLVLAFFLLLTLGMMKTIHIIIGLLILTAGFCPFAISEAGEEEVALLEQINLIRSAPFAYGLSLGYDAGILKERGLGENLVLSPYTMDNQLSSIAARVNLGATGAAEPEDCPVPLNLRYTETSGVLSFFNFIPADVAGRIFVDNLFMNEINSGRFEYILSNEYDQAGVSVIAGTNEENTNAWFLTLSLGSSARIFEGQLVNLVNQLRADPWHATDILEMDMKDLLFMDVELDRILSRKMAPLFFQPALLSSARLIAESAAVGSDPFDTDDTEAYEGKVIKQYAGEVAIEDGDMEEAVNTVFKQIVTADVENWQTHLGILNVKAMDIGPGINLGIHIDGQEDTENRMFFGLNTGIPDPADGESAPDRSGQSKIYGLLFIDSDGNGLYAPGEEVRARDIRIYDADAFSSDENAATVATPATDNAGRFILSLESDKSYRFIYTPTEDDNCEAVDLTQYIDGDVFIKLPLPVLDAPH